MRNFITTVEIEGAFSSKFDHVLFYAIGMYLEGDELGTIQEYIERELLELHSESYWEDADNNIQYLNLITRFMDAFNKTAENIRDTRNDLNALNIPFNVSPLNVNSKRLLLSANFGTKHNE